MGTSVTQLIYKILTLCLLHILLSSYIGSVDAAWLTPSIEELDGEDRLDGISIIGTNNISIRENVGKGLGRGFALVKFRVSTNESIEKYSGSTLFSAESIDGAWYLNLSRPLDYEQPREQSFDIYFRTISNYASKRFTIQVEDENDNRPRVTKRVPNPIPPVNELKLIDDKPILSIEAVDNDKADTIEYSLLEDDQVSDHFRITDTGEIFMTQPLSYTKKRGHTLNVVVSDCCREPRLKHVEIVNVFVQEKPKVPPEFVTSAVQEHLRINTLITKVQAIDGDYPISWEIEYEMEDDDLFMIDRVSGEIKVKSDINAESPRFRDGLTHEIKVFAVEKPPQDFNNSDFQPMIQSNTFTFSIVDLDDNPPLLCNANDLGSCTDTERFYTFTIDKTHVGPITMEDGGEIRVKDIDWRKVYNTFSVDFAPGTNEIIKKAFTITPDRGTKEETFSLSVLPQNSDWIDIGNEELDGFWNKEQTFTIEITGTNNSSHKAYARIKAKVIADTL